MQSSTYPGDVTVARSFFGVPSAVAMSAEKPSVEFPKLVPSDYGPVLQVIGVGVDANDGPDARLACVQNISEACTSALDTGWENAE